MYDYERVLANRLYYLNCGRCPACGGKNPVRPGFGSCETCAEKARERSHSLRQRRRENGLCSSCGGPVDDAAYRTCSACRERMRNYMADYNRR